MIALFRKSSFRRVLHWCSSMGKRVKRLFCITAYKYVCLRVDISIMLMGDASDITRYDRRKPELSNAPLHMK